MVLVQMQGELNNIRDEIMKFKVGAPARVGLVAPNDVEVPAGGTGLDPSSTNFFQVCLSKCLGTEFQTLFSCWPSYALASICTPATFAAGPSDHRHQGERKPCCVLFSCVPSVLSSTILVLQVLNIPTKINKGTVEITSNVALIKTGDKVGASEATLLAKLGIKPFSYGLIVKHVSETYVYI